MSVSYAAQSLLEVKSKYDAEFRRIGLNRHSVAKFDEFYQLVERLHGLNGIQFNIFYTDKDGDLLPINNDMNLARVLQVTMGLLRLILQRKGECYATGGGEANSHNNTFSNPLLNNTNSSASYRASNLISHIKSLKELSSSHGHHRHGGDPSSMSSASASPFHISYPEDFRPVSAIIDVDILPDTYRRVRLHKHKSSKPLGFYIRDGRSLRVMPDYVEQVPGIFISRLMPGGLAESTGLLSVNDEVVEVNGIEVAGKTLDQVTDMMVANSSNLIITVKPTNPRYNLNRSSNSTSGSTISGGGGGGGTLPQLSHPSSSSSSRLPTMPKHTQPQQLSQNTTTTTSHSTSAQDATHRSSSSSSTSSFGNKHHHQQQQQQSAAANWPPLPPQPSSAKAAAGNNMQHQQQQQQQQQLTTGFDASNNSQQQQQQQLLKTSISSVSSVSSSFSSLKSSGAQHAAQQLQQQHQNIKSAIDFSRPSAVYNEHNDDDDDDEDDGRNDEDQDRVRSGEPNEAVMPLAENGREEQEEDEEEEEEYDDDDEEIHDANSDHSSDQDDKILTL